jgi:predicted transposase/invertase (TIGR01784 family)
MDELSRLRGSYTKGKQEGIEEGIEKGREEEKIAMVKRLLAERVDPEVLAKTSGLPLEQVRKLITPQS